MAYVSQSQPNSILAGIGDFFMSLFNAADLTAAANARVRQMEKLNAKSDAELAKMGLRREDIARYVFRDIYHL